MLKRILIDCIYIIYKYFFIFRDKGLIYIKIYICILLIIFIISFIIDYYLGNNIKNNFFLKKINLNKELTNFKSYSQFLEDLILFCIFYDIKNGFYIDIGANDPDHISVTKAFYLRGWYGINIEPLSNKYNLLVKNRPRDINLQIGVGQEKGKASFYEYGAGSSLLQKFSRNNSKISVINIDTMQNICKMYTPKKEKIQFCKIDIEGGEKNALLGFDFENFRPKVFCIESTLPGTGIPCHDQWEYILFKNDYSFALQYKINRYYIDNRIQYLRKRFILAEREISKYYHKNSSVHKEIISKI